MILHDTHSNEGVLQPVGAPVTNLATATFAKADNSMFLIKNDNDATVTLVVKYFKQSAFVTTTFLPGWNPDAIVAIQTNALVSNLLYSL